MAIGRFGPYIKHAGKFVSIPKDYSPQTITLEESEALILKKREEESKKVVMTFDEDPDMEVLNGRYGVYICYKKSNYKIPKGTDTANLTYKECVEIVSDEANAPKKGARRTTKKKA